MPALELPTFVYGAQGWINCGVGRYANFPFFQLPACGGNLRAKKYSISMFPVSGSPLLPLAHSVTVTLTHFCSLWPFPAHSGSLCLTLASLSLALSGAHWLVRSLLGSLRRSCVALVCPALFSSILLEAFLRHPEYRGQGGQLLVPST